MSSEAVEKSRSIQTPPDSAASKIGSNRVEPQPPSALGSLRKLLGWTNSGYAQRGPVPNTSSVTSEYEELVRNVFEVQPPPDVVQRSPNPSASDPSPSTLGWDWEIGGEGRSVDDCGSILFRLEHIIQRCGSKIVFEKSLNIHILHVWRWRDDLLSSLG